MILDLPITDRPLSPEALSDLQAVSEALESGTPVDPIIAKRVRERSAEARKLLLATKGVQNVAVDLIRDIRGELSKS